MQIIYENCFLKLELLTKLDVIWKWTFNYFTAMCAYMQRCDDETCFNLTLKWYVLFFNNYCKRCWKSCTFRWLAIFDGNRLYISKIIGCSGEPAEHAFAVMLWRYSKKQQRNAQARLFSTQRWMNASMSVPRLHDRGLKS